MTRQHEYFEIEELVDKIITKIEVNYDNNEISFYTSDGYEYKMLHEQECCECVYIEDICGDIQKLVGEPILVAEERIKEPNDNEIGFKSYTWTFYHLVNKNAYVDIRWFGESNGYYSEGVDTYKYSYL